MKNRNTGKNNKTTKNMTILMKRTLVLIGFGVQVQGWVGFDLLIRLPSMCM